MSSFFLRSLCLLAIITLFTGCSMWPWGSTSEDPVPGNRAVGQQTFLQRADGSFSNNMQSDFRR